MSGRESLGGSGLRVTLPRLLEGGFPIPNFPEGGFLWPLDYCSAYPCYQLNYY